LFAFNGTGYGFVPDPGPSEEFRPRRIQGGAKKANRENLRKKKKKKMQRGNAGEVVMKIIIMIFFKTKKLVLLQRVLETRKTQKNFFDCLSLGV
jgi:hypothetical protein